MNKVIYGQYDSRQYPLKRYFYKEVPYYIEKVIMKLNSSELAVFRGGLAYIFLINKGDYLLKDLDMLALETNMNAIIDMLSEADIVFVNKNTFGDNVVTAFWKAKEDYYKLDILLCNELPTVCKFEYDNYERITVAASYIWRNRIEKIAEKELRKHDDKKTMNHYKVVRMLSEYLQKHKEEIYLTDAKIVEKKINSTEKVLRTLLNDDEVDEFIRIQLGLIRC